MTEESQSKLDVAELKVRMRTALEFRHQVGPVTFKLRAPTPLDLRIAAVRHAGTPDYSQLVTRDVVRASILDWSGLKVSDIAPEDPEAGFDLPCTAETIELLTELNLSLYDEIRNALLMRQKERADKLEADAKNSSSASTGSVSG